MDVEVLINEVHKCPMLWDSSDSHYNDRNRKYKAWTCIASMLFDNFENENDMKQKIIVREVISKWRGCRDNYIRSLRKQSEYLKTGSTKKIHRYIYCDLMSFLKQDKIIEERYKEELSDNWITYTETLDHYPPGSPEIQKIPGYSIANPPSPIKQETVSIEEKNISYLNSMEEDEDLSFYKSTLPIVKTLDMDQKIQFRIQVMQLLQNIKQQQ